VCKKEEEGTIITSKVALAALSLSRTRYELATVSDSVLSLPSLRRTERLTSYRISDKVTRCLSTASRTHLVARVGSNPSVQSHGAHFSSLIVKEIFDKRLSNYRTMAEGQLHSWGTAITSRVSFLLFSVVCTM
jgi:hypothetical protein